MEPQGNAFQRAVGVLQRLDDAELLDSYKRYMDRLEATIGPAWMDTYAAIYQRDRRLLSGASAGSLVLPEEIELRDRALADAELASIASQFIQQLERKQIIDERYID